MKVLVRLACILEVLFISALIAVAQTTPRDLSGRWNLKSGPNPNDVELIEIKQSVSQIQVAEKHGTKKPDRVLTFYTDARGESNIASDGKSYLKSRTKWVGETLFTQFDSLSNQSGVNERYDEWTLSKDGKTITVTTTFTTNGPRSMRSVFGSASSTKTYQTTRKRVFINLN